MGPVLNDSQCIPGGTCDASVTLTNPNSSPLVLYKVTDNGNAFQDPNGNAG